MVSRANVGVYRQRKLSRADTTLDPRPVSPAFIPTTQKELNSILIRRIRACQLTAVFRRRAALLGDANETEFLWCWTEKEFLCSPNE